MRHLDLVRGPATRFGAKTAVVEGDRRVTFAELDDRVGRLGAALRARGLAPGDRVALLAANELEYLEIQAACLRSGFALVPLNTRLAQRELGFILSDSAPALLIAGRGEEERAAGTGIPHLLSLGAPRGIPSYDAALADAIPDSGADPGDAELPATILYTSGTTGSPKGAVVDRLGFTARVMINAVEMEVRAGDVHQASLPMFHIAAFLSYAHTAVGATLVMLPEFAPERALDTLARERVTTTVLVPTIIALLLESPLIDQVDLSALRLIVYGGSSIEPGPLRRALARFGCGFHQQYGMTETGGQTILRPGDHDPADTVRLASAGTEAIGLEVRVVGDGDKPVAQGEVGEIVCRGPSVMRRYWNRPEATAAALRGGWMHTGDLGYRDEGGYLHITDRRNDMIITGGENVYPREVEAVLSEHPGIAEVAVVGAPDPVWGQVVTAVVVGDAHFDGELTAWARERLAGYKVPRRWIRAESLPRNVTGKVLKHRLRAMLSG
ncbi:long-chain fatty acid--CoA ligase [Acrocarpospora macrocephala]|uniref:Putative long-chain-fatty-acid CoA ligase n=1 Tax=Acrocarpospora macrocephala TaxID=150177 RepID=A0A5M3WZM8_9ACTN|nr:AMP-binding protein [Acrocarpospora macrocephala]GES11508.1 putative long-chain-fatty-acid CoA ligase [Acrocarpospora macrocephala]